MSDSDFLHIGRSARVNAPKSLPRRSCDPGLRAGNRSGREYHGGPKND